MPERRILSLVAGVAALTLGGAVSGIAAEVNLKAASAVLTNLEFTQAYLRLFVDKVNENGKGVAQITYLGGPEVTPPRKAAAALKRGLFDILYAPGSYYVGEVSEANLLIASNLAPPELRKNGAWEMLQEAWGKKINARLLAWCCAETQFHLYFSKAPGRTSSGNIDLTGFKVRSTPVYRPLIEGLGGTPVEMKASEIYTGVQRGVVDGYGWLPVGVTKLGLHKATKYRIDPPFFRTTNTLMMNLKSGGPCLMKHVL